MITIVLGMELRRDWFTRVRGLCIGALGYGPQSREGPRENFK